MNSSTVLRPNQIAEYEGTKNSLEAKLNNPRIQDKASVRRQLNRVEREFDRQRPKEYADADKDKAARRGAELLEKITHGMPSQEEMRKCPPGAINKHREWESSNKADIQEWKGIQLRLNAGTDDPDVANLEKFRPTRSSLNMDNAMIPGSQTYLPSQGARSVTFSDEEISLLREFAPEEIYNRLALLDADQRMLVRQQFLDPIAEVSDENKAAVEAKVAAEPEAADAPEEKQDDTGSQEWPE